MIHSTRTLLFIIVICRGFQSCVGVVRRVWTDEELHVAMSDSGVGVIEIAANITMSLERWVDRVSIERSLTIRSAQGTDIWWNVPFLPYSAVNCVAETCIFAIVGPLTMVQNLTQITGSTMGASPIFLTYPPNSGAQVTLANYTVILDRVDSFFDHRSNQYWASNRWYTKDNHVLCTSNRTMHIKEWFISSATRTRIWFQDPNRKVEHNNGSFRISNLTVKLDHNVEADELRPDIYCRLLEERQELNRRKSSWRDMAWSSEKWWLPLMAAVIAVVLLGVGFVLIDGKRRKIRAGASQMDSMALSPGQDLAPLGTALPGEKGPVGMDAHDMEVGKSSAGETNEKDIEMGQLVSLHVECPSGGSYRIAHTCSVPDRDKPEAAALPYRDNLEHTGGVSRTFVDFSTIAGSLEDPMTIQSSDLTHTLDVPEVYKMKSAELNAPTKISGLYSSSMQHGSRTPGQGPLRLLGTPSHLVTRIPLPRNVQPAALLQALQKNPFGCTVLNYLGAGGNGVVYRALWKEQELVALKVVLHKVEGGDVGRKRALAEAMLGCQVRHPNLVVTVDYHVLEPCSVGDTGSTSSEYSVTEGSETVTSTYLLMEFCDRGTLRSLMKGPRWDPCGVGYVFVLVLLSEVASAVHYLHDNNIIHGDLKSSNVLLKTNTNKKIGFDVKVGDFGISRVLQEVDSTHTTLSRPMGTLTHMAPELIQGKHLSKAADIYAFGMIIYELMTGLSPFQGHAYGQVVYLVLQNDVHEVLKFGPACPAAVVSLAHRCWSKDPKDRPKINEVDRELHDLLLAEAGADEAESFVKEGGPSKMMARDGEFKTSGGR